MPYIEFEVYCGVCGSGICHSTNVNDTTLTVTCEECKAKINELEIESGNLEDEVYELKEEIRSLESTILEMKED